MTRLDSVEYLIELTFRQKQLHFAGCESYSAKQISNAKKALSFSMPLQHVCFLEQNQVRVDDTFESELLK